jgi:hypothetical protein
VAVSALAGALVICTFLLPGTSIPGAFVWLAFGLTFPVFGTAVLGLGMRREARSRDFSVQRRRNRLLWRRIRERVPRAVLVVIGAVFLLAWLAGATAILQMKGGLPERNGDRYFTNNHGDLIPLTKADYERQLTVQYRGIAAISMGLCTAAAGLVLAGPLRPEDEDSRP